MSRKTRKLIWSAPLLAVLAVAGALAIFMVLVPNEAAAHEAAMHGPPAPVTMLAAEAADDDPNTPALEGRNAVSVMWKASATTGDNASDAATHYRIDRSTDTRVWMSLEPSLADADVACDSSVGANYRCHMDTGLEPNTTYQYRVFAINAFGISAVSVDDTYVDATTEPVGAPMAARNLEATDDQEEQIDLSWTAPADNGGADILLYCIVVATPSGTLTDLAADTTDANDECKEVTATSTDVAIEALTDDLEIAAAANSAGNGVIIIEATDDDDMPMTSFDHLKLETPDVMRLRYRVYAVNDEDGKLSTPMDREISASITNTADGRTITDALDPGDEIQKPAAPTNLRAVVKVDDDGLANPEVRLYWTVPDDHPTAADLMKIDADAMRAIEVARWTGSTNGYAVIDSEITCQTDAVDVAQIAPAQCVIAATTLTSDTNQRSDTYRVRYVITSGGREIPGYDETTGVGLPLTADNAQGNLPLIIVADDGDAPMLNLRSAVNQQDPKTAIDLLWQRNPNTAETPEQPTGYVVEYSVDDGVTWKTLRNADRPRDLGTNTNYTHSGVVPGKKYTYRVFPWHNSAYGLPLTIEASSEPADVPDPVQNLRVSAAGEDALKLEWNSLPASRNGGHPVIGYLVQVSGDADNDSTNDNAKAVTGTGNNQWSSVGLNLNATPPKRTTVDKDTNTYTFKAPVPNELTAGSLRWFRVFAITLENDGVGSTGGDELAVNYAGRTELSPTADDISGANEVDGITDAIDDPSATPADQPAGVPAGLTAEPSHSINLIARTDRGVLLLWNEPEHTPQTRVTSYVIERQVVGTDTEWQPEGQVTWTGVGDIKKRTSYVDTENPDTDEVRMYRVGSKNIAGTTWGTTVMYPAAHGAHVPGMPSAMATADSGTQITVTWTAAADGAATTSYMLQRAYMGDDDMMTEWMDVTVANMGMDMMHVDMGLMSGTTYYYRVLAMNAAGNSEWSDGMAMAMTEEAADATLGDAMGLVGAVGSESNTIELTWTVGDNADIHWVFGIHTSNDIDSLIWTKADASDSHTVDMTGKPRGSYTFFVIAGQTDDAKWSAWTPGTVTY
jgi:hypothetical protein